MNLVLISPFNLRHLYERYRLDSAYLSTPVTMSSLYDKFPLNYNGTIKTERIVICVNSARTFLFFSFFFLKTNVAQNNFSGVFTNEKWRKSLILRSVAKQITIIITTSAIRQTVISLWQYYISFIHTKMYLIVIG